MVHFRTYLFAGVVLGLSGCFSASPADGTVKCDPAATRTCPQDYYCATQTSTCFRTGHTPDAGVSTPKTCSAPADCAGGNCVDGFCCNTACKGVCEACNIQGSQGTCSPIPTNTDPDKDCAAQLQVSNADGGLNSPPGGVFTSAGACAGTCSGQRSCTFPGTTTSCGQVFCNDAATVATFSCDGNGTCQPQLAKCSDYKCDIGACKTTCTMDADCQTTDYCNASMKCVPKAINGQACTMPNQCNSGNCVANTAGTAKLCCNSQCDTANSMQCDVTVGTCTCGTLSCANGCQLFYVDADGDGHGDQSGTLTNGRAVAGCVGMSSLAAGGKNYFPDDMPNKGHLDCDDNDANVYYGQTGYFSIPRLHPNPLSYDYDCDGVESKGLQEYTHGCLACAYFGTVMCGGANPTCSTDPNFNFNVSGFNCGFSCNNGKGGFACCGFGPDGFTGAVACGEAGGTSGHPWTHCTDCPSGNTPGAQTDANKKQSCH